MRLFNDGKMCLVVLALALSGCRSSKPPAIGICIGDGLGGADCIGSDNSKFYMSPSDLKNFFMLSQSDEARFVSWCFDTTEAHVQPWLENTKDEVKRD